MNKKVFLRSFMSVASSNLLVVILGVLMLLALPRLMGSVEDYGYWQLYYYYSGFFGLFLFGLNDGMNLLYAGTKLNKLNKKVINAVLGYIILSTAIIAFLLGVAALVLIQDSSLRLTFALTAINIFILNVNGFSMHINQVSLRFKEYSIINGLERAFFVTSLLPLFFLDVKDYVYYIVLNLVIRFLVALYGILSIRNILSKSLISLGNILEERKVVLGFIRVGWFLTFGTICATLIGTSSRIVVEHTMSIYEYGLFAFAFSLSMIVSLLASALPTVLYPSLKAIGEVRYNSAISILYLVIVLAGTLMLSMCFFTPIFLDMFLPEYKNIETYIYLLFPWIIYQLLTTVVIDVFYRLARLEKRLFINYVLGVVLVFGVQFLAISLFKDMRIMLLAGLVVYSLWVHYCKYYLFHKSNWKVPVWSYMEIPFIAMFLAVIIMMGYGLISFFVYLAAWIALSLVVYLIWSKDINNIFIFARNKSSKTSVGGEG